MRNHDKYPWDTRPLAGKGIKEVLCTKHLLELGPSPGVQVLKDRFENKVMIRQVTERAYVYKVELFIKSPGLPRVHRHERQIRHGSRGNSGPERVQDLPGIKGLQIYTSDVASRMFVGCAKGFLVPVSKVTRPVGSPTNQSR